MEISFLHAVLVLISMSSRRLRRLINLSTDFAISVVDSGVMVRGLGDVGRNEGRDVDSTSGEIRGGLGDERHRNRQAGHR